MKHVRALGFVSFALLCACTGNGAQVTEEDPPIGSDVFVTAMPEGEVTVPGHGKEVGMAVAPIAGINGGKANGVTTAHYFEDGSTIIGVQANVPPAEDGFFYEAWVAGETDNEWISIGRMANLFGDARHSVRFEVPEDLRNRARIVITREVDDGNPGPGEEIAEGILKPTKR